MSNCGICRAELNIKGKRLSSDCGGECWGCIGLIEVQMGCQESIKAVLA